MGLGKPVDYIQCGQCVVTTGEDGTYVLQRLQIGHILLLTLDNFKYYALALDLLLWQ